MAKNSPIDTRTSRMAYCSKSLLPNSANWTNRFQSISCPSVGGCVVTIPKSDRSNPGRLEDGLRLKAVRHPFSEEFNARLRPRTFSSWRWGRHDRAADSPDAIVDGGSVLFDVIVTCQVEGLHHSLNVSLRKKGPNVRLKARRFRHCASQVLEFTDVSVCFVNLRLPIA